LYIGVRRHAGEGRKIYMDFLTSALEENCGLHSPVCINPWGKETQKDKSAATKGN
jgi:hypothetical protein